MRALRRDTLYQAFEEQFNYTERLMLAEIAQLPDGSWEFEDFGDQDVMSPGKPPIRVHCRMTKKGKKLSFDWTTAPAAARPGLQLCHAHWRNYLAS